MERVMRIFGALILGVFTGLAISYTGPMLDWGFAVNAATPPAAAQWVDRTFKSDRLDLQHATRVGKQPVKPEKLLVGCEPAASPLSKARAAIPGRCST
jgi:hypothetical protein